MLAQAFLDLGTRVLTALIAAQSVAASQRRVAATAGLWMAAVCPFTADYTAVVLTESLAIFLTALAIFVLVQILSDLVVMDFPVGDFAGRGGGVGAGFVTQTARLRPAPTESKSNASNRVVWEVRRMVFFRRDLLWGGDFGASGGAANLILRRTNTVPVRHARPPGGCFSPFGFALVIQGQTARPVSQQLVRQQFDGHWITPVVTQFPLLLTGCREKMRFC